MFDVLTPRPFIKFCGMTRPEDVTYAVELGVDAIGMILVPDTARGITLAQAEKLRALIPSHIAVITVVRNEPMQQLDKIMTRLKPSVLQLHGDESPAFCASLKYPFWKTIAVKDKLSAARDAAVYSCAAGLVFDTWTTEGTGGHGVAFDREHLPARARNSQQLVILAGGLCAENLQDVNQLIKDEVIDVIDVSSGIEASGALQLKGVKSHQRMCQFVEVARQFKS